ncbi:MAG: metallophosphoesterase [Clostridia bacterium]|nr:metallophosphoesterase [Clostridia bacterium]
MKVFAIGDLHMPGGMEKPMGVFGSKWDDHIARFSRTWKCTVSDNDIVLIPGDISWAMRLEDALPDLYLIHELPGTKVLLRGNHDYWWSSIGKLRTALPPSIHAIQNDAVTIGDYCIFGTRGWTYPGMVNFSETNDRHIYEREVLRLQLSATRVDASKCVICMMHFPPISDARSESGFLSAIELSGAKTVVYAHLHGRACDNAFEGEYRGVEYMLCSCDYIGFKPRLICESN